MSSKKSLFFCSLLIVISVGFGTFYGIKYLNDKNIEKNPFELKLSSEELAKRTDGEYFNTIYLLDENSPEYKRLAYGDKIALKHLVKAAKIMQSVHFQLDNRDNIPFAEYLNSEIAKGNKNAKMTMRLFIAQRGIAAFDVEGNIVELAKGHSINRGFYPKDLTKEHFHNILLQMLQKGEKDTVKKILSQRTVVDWTEDKKSLYATDYAEKFGKEFNEIATELEIAADNSTNPDFNEYLRLQAKALRKADPILDAYADKKWATLQFTPLEFTITRESYSDAMTKSILSNQVLSKILEDLRITPFSKDSLGCRVGIVNYESTKNLLKIKEFLPKLAELMPHKEKYVQNITKFENKQTMTDVDLVYMTGDCGAYRGKITIAENLPNNDKLSLTLGGGKRNVYHRQIRFNLANDEKIKRKLDAILAPELHKYYNKDAVYRFTVSHENAHSLGPKTGTEKLGEYKCIIEENKADMAALAFVDFLTQEKFYTPEQRKQIVVSAITDWFLKAKPNLSQAHRVRSLMQINYLMKEGAVKINDNDLIEIDIDKSVRAAQKMLNEIIELQLSGNVKKAEKFVNEYYEWNDKLEAVASKLREADKDLSGEIICPLANKLLTE